MIYLLNSQDQDDAEMFKKCLETEMFKSGTASLLYYDWTTMMYHWCKCCVCVCVLIVRRDAAAVNVNSEVRRLRRCVTDAQAKYDSLTQVRLCVCY